MLNPGQLHHHSRAINLLLFSSVSVRTIVKAEARLQDQLSEPNTPLTLSGPVETDLHLFAGSVLHNLIL